MMERQITCILCPNGCELDVFIAGKPTSDTICVEGNLCPKGIQYAIEEILSPKRTLTTSVLVRNGLQPQASVKTAEPIPRELVVAVREALRAVALDAPVEIGDVVVPDILSTGVEIVVTRAVASRT